MVKKKKRMSKKAAGNEKQEEKKSDKIFALKLYENSYEKHIFLHRKMFSHSFFSVLVCFFLISVCRKKSSLGTRINFKKISFFLPSNQMYSYRKCKFLMKIPFAILANQTNVSDDWILLENVLNRMKGEKKMFRGLNEF